MRTHALACLTLTFVTLAFSCGDDDDDATEDKAQCRDLGEYCHDAGLIDEAAQECHEVMHAAADGCMARYDECRAICRAVLDGAGGEGGGGAGGAGAIGGNVECQELGEYCHGPGQIDEAAQECHEVMHEASPGCELRLDECRAICDAVIEASGGAGGGGASSGGVGGAG